MKWMLGIIVRNFLPLNGLILGCFLSSIAQARSSSVSASLRADLETIKHEYKTPDAIPWSDYLGIIVTPPLKPLLDQAKYQEAVWHLLDLGKNAAANRLDYFLRDLLEQGFIKGVNNLGMGGMTRPKAVSLPFGVTGVYKSDQPWHPSSNYRSEIAAYEISRTLAFNLVPMTVKRRVNRRRGSIQYFVAGAKKPSELEQYSRSAKLNIFDYIISNRDRNSGNILILSGREVGIDHGLSLRNVNSLGHFLTASARLYNALGIIVRPIRQEIVRPQKQVKAYSASKNFLHHLADFPVSDFHKQLRPFLSKRKRSRVLRRKDQVLTELCKAGLLF